MFNSNSMYKLEVSFLHILKNSKYIINNIKEEKNNIITDNIKEAKYFFIPHFTTFIFHKYSLNEETKFFDRNHEKHNNYLKNIINYINNNYNDNFKKNIKKHILCFEWDKGYKNLNDENQKVFKNCIKLQYNNFNKKERIIQVPVCLKNEKLNIKNKDKFVFGAGSIYEDLNYSKGFRQRLIYLKKNKRFSNKMLIFFPGVNRNDYDNYCKTTKYILCPEGWTSWTPRIYESLLFKSIPVLLSNDFNIPFSNLINLEEGIIRIRNIDDLDNLEEIINKNDINYNKKQKFWEKNRNKLLWNYDKKLNEQEVGILILKFLKKFNL